MKRTTVIAFLLVLGAGTWLQAQDVPARYDEARSAYQSGNLEDARFALQQALNEINQVVGREILNLLPAEWNGMTIDTAADNVTGTSAGFAGLYVNRGYTGENREASIEIISDSPMLASLNAVLTMPAFMASDQNQKRIKVSNYKALMTKDVDEQGNASYEIQVPCSSLLLTISCSGIQDEDEAVNMANSLPVDQIVKLTR